MEAGGIFPLQNKSLGGSKRMKISRACDECRKKKVKCDGNQPCGRCKKSTAECVFAKLPPKRGPPKHYMENLENRLQRVEKALKSVTTPMRKIFESALEFEMKKTLPDTDTTIPDMNKKTVIFKQQSSVSYTAPYTSDMAIDRFTINEIGQAVYVNDTKVRTDRIQCEGEQQDNIQQNDTQSDVASISDSSPASSSAPSFFHQPPTIVATHVVFEEKPIPDCLSFKNIIPEVQTLTEIYFDHVHKYAPMIHKPTFLKQMQSATNPPSKFLLYAMCAVATRWSPEYMSMQQQYNLTTAIVPPPGYTYYQNALGILDEFTDSPRLSTVQGLILLVKYQEYLQRTGYFHRSYFYLSMAVRMCSELGLSQLEGDVYDAETKRRTFWVIFMYDLFMSIERGQETYFDSHKCTTGFPLVTGEEGPALEELITNQNIFIQLGKVLSEIYVLVRHIDNRQQTQGINTRTKEQTVEEQTRLFSLHTHLENFLYEVPPALTYPPTLDNIEKYPAEKHSIQEPFIGFLHMTYHFSVILLHRTYVNCPPPATEYNFISYRHRKLCAASASNITRIAETLSDQFSPYTFSYPTRGVQHTIHCLSMAATIHKYEMLNSEDEHIRDAAELQYVASLGIIQKLSTDSPCIELPKRFNHKLDNFEKQMSTPVVPYYQPQQPQQQPQQPQQQQQQQQQHQYMYRPLDKPKIRRNTLSATVTPTIAVNESALYQSSAEINEHSHLTNILTQQHHQEYNAHQAVLQQQQHRQWNISPEEYQIYQHQQQHQSQMQHHVATGTDTSMNQYCSPEVQESQQYQQVQQTWNQPTTSDYYNGQTMTATVTDGELIIPSQQQSPYVPNLNNGRSRRHTYSHYYSSQQQHGYYSDVPLSIETSVPNIMMMENNANDKMDNTSNIVMKHMNYHHHRNNNPINVTNSMINTATTSGDLLILNNNNMVTTVVNEDSIMLDSTSHNNAHHHHQYDPTPGMSQLFLTDNQQRFAWDTCMVSDTGTIQRSEGHVMK